MGDNGSCWPEQVQTVHVPSTMDGTKQPMLYYYSSSSLRGSNTNTDEDNSPSSSSNRRPLLVALHTWSNDYRQGGGGEIVYANWCIDQKWHFCHPNFRGPNNTNPAACGSDLACQDVVDAVEYIKAKTNNVEENRIYLVGVSGGGHMALLLGGRYPRYWAGVSAWAPISDIAIWWKERVNGLEAFQKYAKNIEAVVGGKPDGTDDQKVLDECRKRSPVTYLLEAAGGSGAANVNLDINAGIHDGKGGGGSVPFSHSLRAYNAAIPISERIEEEEIEKMYITRCFPSSSCCDEPSHDEDDVLLYGGRKIYYRKTCSNVRVTIFEGGHEILHEAALNWLNVQRRDNEAVWTIPPNQIHELHVTESDQQAGK